MCRNDYHYWSISMTITQGFNDFDECHHWWCVTTMMCCCAGLSSHEPYGLWSSCLNLVMVSCEHDVISGWGVGDIQYHRYEHWWFRWMSSLMMCYSNDLLLCGSFITRTVCACRVGASIIAINIINNSELLQFCIVMRIFRHREHMCLWLWDLDTLLVYCEHDAISRAEFLYVISKIESMSINDFDEIHQWWWVVVMKYYCCLNFSSHGPCVHVW